MDNDAERLVQRAIRRDLCRARLLLSTTTFIDRGRRRALVQHLGWLAGLLSADDAEMRAALGQLADAARDYHECGDPRQRRALLTAAVRLHTLLVRGRDWVGPAAIAGATKDVYWLVDGLDARSCEHVTRVLAPRTTPISRRQRADVYRYRKTVLWGGTPAYAVPAQRVGWTRPA
jgi:hypothetical protein